MSEKKVKKPYPTQHYKLGEKASIFWDPSAQNSLSEDKGLKVTSARPTEYSGPVSKRMKIALSHNHIVKIDSDEADKMKEVIESGKEDKEPTLEETLNGLKDKAAIIKYYKDNYDDLDDDELERFGNLKRAEMVAELVDEAEEED
jgi:hypothetical protein